MRLLECKTTEDIFYLLTEKISFVKSIKPHNVIIIEEAIKFLQKIMRLSTNVDIRVKQAKRIGIGGGAIKIGEGKYTMEINFENTYRKILLFLAHELTHVQQFEDGYLDYDMENKTIVYKDMVITWKEYLKLQKKDPIAYKELPWEKEAFDKGKKYGKLFDNSSFINVLKKYNDPNINLAINNPDRTAQPRSMIG